MLDPLQFYCRVLCNGMKTRFRMVMIAHPGPGIGFHKRFMWQIIIPPTPQTSQMVGQRGKDAYFSASGSMYRTRARYDYTPSATTTTTPQQDTSGRPRPRS